MIRVLTFLFLVFLFALGGAWIAERPGIVSIDWEGYRIQASLMTSVIGVLGLIVVGIVVWGAFRLVWRSPKLTSQYMQRRKKDQGYTALSKGIMALGAGDPLLARRHGMHADKLLKGDEPAVKLLLAQTSQIAGNSQESRSRFEAMLEDPRSKTVGLHGLFVEAERENEPEAAHHFAERAADLVPGLKWAGNAVLGYQAVSGDWESAVSALDRNYNSKLIDRKTHRRHKAVLITARALELEDQQPDKARSLAREAHGLAPDLVPAGLLAARLYIRKGDVRKASKILEATWKLCPHPDVANAYMHVRPGDSVVERYKRATHLSALRANSTEGALAVALAAMDAGKFDVAREKLREVLKSDPSQRAFLLMADLEDAEHGNEGRVREWLARAVRAPQDKMWIADGISSAHWAPVSPKTGEIDAFEWKTPEGSFGVGDELEVLDDSLFEPPAIPAAVTIVSEPREEETDKKGAEAKVAAEGDVVELEPVKEEPQTLQETQSEDDQEAKKASTSSDKKESLVDFPMKHLPDDPGPDKKESSGKDDSYRFFR
ncbi:heme biosynthesis protein HemY [Flexibacterium corallicola]|uniref:heme biosynthesis protein HemY n=1 Tax=Flexibacterium corallicola TaxID=3037259 RepID=UPI00286F30EC|nr:heme biosynthesis HemY N-terminal domain-containing protein [Pseudovibrio sp. M1P-2-3]